jgi:hypothetical protein
LLLTQAIAATTKNKTGCPHRIKEFLGERLLPINIPYWIGILNTSIVPITNKMVNKILYINRDLLFQNIPQLSIFSLNQLFPIIISLLLFGIRFNLFFVTTCIKGFGFFFCYINNATIFVMNTLGMGTFHRTFCHISQLEGIFSSAS